MNEELKAYLDKEFGTLHDEITEVSQSVNMLASHIDERFDEIAPALGKIENHEKRIKFLEDKLPKVA